MSPTPMFSPEQRQQIAVANRKIGEDWNQRTQALVEAFMSVVVEIGRRMRALEEALAPIAADLEHRRRTAARRVGVTPVHPGGLELMRKSNATPSPELRAAIQRAGGRRRGHRR